MNISERNKQNIKVRWEKIHQKDIDYIKQNKFLELKSRICGFIAGDGNILVSNGTTCTHNTLRFFPDHISMVNAFEEAMIKLYNRKPKIKDKGTYFWVTLDSKPIVHDLLKIGKFGKLKWAIPKLVFKSYKNKIEWLRSFFDCEAHIHKDYIRIQSVNKNGLEQVKSLLKEIGINSKIYIYIPKNKNYNINYILSIHKKEDKKKYLDLIGFNHTIKLKKLKDTLNSTPRSRKGIAQNFLREI